MDANFIVMIVVLIIWAGIFLYLLSLDKKIEKLKQYGKKDEN